MKARQHPIYNTTPVIAQSSGGDFGLFRSIIDAFQDTFGSTDILLLLALGGVLGVMAIFLGGKKNKLTTAKWAEKGDKLQLLRQGKKLLKSPDVDDVCLYVRGSKSWHTAPILPELSTLFSGKPPILFLPKANQSIEITGKPGSGKTFSSADPLCASAIEQGHSLLLYDFKADEQGKGGQIDYLCTHALRHGYKVSIFAPGRDYTCTINPLDFLEDANDTTTAMNLAKTFHSNVKGNQGKTDGFFGPAGARLVQALFQLAKGTKYPDLAMAFTFLQLSKFPKRLAKAAQEGNPLLPEWVRVQFDQLIKVADVEKTAGGIEAGAIDALTDFIQPALLGCMMGKSTAPFILGEKQMVVFQSDIYRAKIINPFHAAIMETMINLNFSFQRKTPMVCSFDEASTFTITDAPNWANLHRSKGGVFMFAYQNAPQMREAYGKDQAQFLSSGLANKFWFNPGDKETADQYSQFLGDTEIVTHDKSRTRNRGSSGGSVSRSEKTNIRPLKSADSINKMKLGECIYINPVMGGGVPWNIEQIEITKEYIKRRKECIGIWEEEVLENLTQREQKARGIYGKSQEEMSVWLQEELRKRQAEAERLFPLPDDEQEPSNKVSAGGSSSAVPGGLSDI